MLSANYCEIWIQKTRIILKTELSTRICCYHDRGAKLLESICYICSSTEKHVRKLFKGNLEGQLRSEELQQRQSATVKSLKTSYTCFLAHEWGEEEADFDTHRRVRDVAQRLKTHGIPVWIDEERLKSNVDREIIEGVDTSKKIIIFLTKRYMARLENDDNNCTKEFRYCIKQKKADDIIVVLFEPGISSHDSWTSFTTYHLSHKLYVDFSTKEKLTSNFPQLVAKLYDVCGDL